MHAVSMVPVIAVVIAATLLWLIVVSTQDESERTFGKALLILWLLGLCLWGLVSRHLALSGAYHEPQFISLMPGFWLPMVPTAWTIAILLLTAARHSMTRMFNDHAKIFVALQALRILAVGGVIKGFAGLLPQSFTFAVGVPDLLFGLSALALLFRWPADGWSSKTLIIWNTIGIAVILPSAPLLMQLALPGPLYILTSQPDASVLFDYPMALAPTLLVPLFVTLNALHVLALAVRTKKTNSN